MQISSRFTIAVHILACIDTFDGRYKLTSDFLAESVNVNPVIIRRLLLQLKAAGLVNVRRGSGGASIARPLGESPSWTSTAPWTAWKTASYSTSTKTPTGIARWGATYTACSTAGSSRCSRLWNASWRR